MKPAPTNQKRFTALAKESRPRIVHLRRIRLRPPKNAKPMKPGTWETTITANDKFFFNVPPKMPYFVIEVSRDSLIMGVAGATTPVFELVLAHVDEHNITQLCRSDYKCFYYEIPNNSISMAQETS